MEMDEASNSALMDLVELQPQVWDHCFSYLTTMTLQCAVELSIADAIHSHGGKPISLPELAAALNIPPAKAPSLSRLMRVLVHLGYFTQQEVDDDDGGSCYSYSAAPLSRLLLKNNPFNARSFITMANHPNAVDPWRQMSTWFRATTPLPAFALAHGGKSLYEVCAADPPFGQVMAEAMAGDSEMFTRVMIEKCREAFHGLNSLVDVGGGSGATAKVIAEAFPTIRCTVFDLPHVVSAAVVDQQQQTSTHPSNLDYVGGDMFTDDIPPADAVFFKWVLCDWPDEAVLKLLKKTLGKNGGGKVMIADHVMGHESCSDESSMRTTLLFDVGIMTCGEGSIRSEKQWAKLFSDAGFADYTITPVCGLRVLIQVYP